MRKYYWRKITIVFVLGFISLTGYSQSFSIQGDIFSDQSAPLGSATIVLLNPADSTMEFFGISNDKGHFELKDLRPGKYLMHIAFLGYQTQYKPVAIPMPGDGYFGAIVMKPKPVAISEVQVVGEYIPLQIRNDTIEFNAKAFKTRPDANVEELLKKMPGIEVDRAGNIKALGKDVRKVLVDGKEFFGNDPKVATKNIPADAVNKVQVYDKRSEESDFTGIDDGTRDKTVNLVLKDDKKNGIFGDATAGAGTGKHYMGSAKAYRFTDKTQAALLGMINNINEFGFSFGDYMSFSGGLDAMSSGGHVMIGGDNGFPINFGQPVSGLSSSGAAGANFSWSWAKDSRIFASYMLNGTNTRVTEKTRTWNYTSGSSFFQDLESNQVKRDTSHRINFGIRWRIDSTQNIIVNGNVGLSSGYNPFNSQTRSYLDDILMNTLWRTSTGESAGLSANATGSYLKKLNRNRTILRLSGNYAYSGNESGSRYVNTTDYAGGNQEISSRFQQIDTRNLNYSAGISLNQKIIKRIFIEPAIRAGSSSEHYKRTQGIPLATDIIIDSLSPDFRKSYRWLRPELEIRRNTDKIVFSAALGMELGEVGTSLWGDSPAGRSHVYLTPRLSWENEYKTGRRLAFYYSSEVNTPSISQLLPVVDNSNPMSVMSGNRNLKPEYSHQLFLHWLLFDQFSFTSLFTTLNAGYTHDKINWSRTVNEQLGQTMTLVNVDNDYNVSGNIDFSTAVRKLGIKFNTAVQERFNRGISLVNGVENINTTLSHRLSLTIDNRKKNKFDVNIGGAFTLTDAWYSIQESLNNRYMDLSWFGEARYFPNDHWNFELTADITNYTARSFDQSVLIPLIGAEISYTFLKNSRGVLTLAGVDLLNKNTGISRVSEMNYLTERQTNMIGRYVMLSFKYRLNKMGSNKEAFEVKIRR